MIRCVVIDDEPPALAILADYIGQMPFLTLAGTTTDPIEGLTWVQQGRARPGISGYPDAPTHGLAVPEAQR